MVNYIDNTVLIIFIAPIYTGWPWLMQHLLVCINFVLVASEGKIALLLTLILGNLAVCTCELIERLAAHARAQSWTSFPGMLG